LSLSASCGILGVMQSELDLRSPSDGTGWRETWTFSGRDERMLRDCLSTLEQHGTPSPEERWDSHRHKYVVVGEDRWQAAMLLFAIDPRWRRIVGRFQLRGRQK